MDGERSGSPIGRRGMFKLVWEVVIGGDAARPAAPARAGHCLAAPEAGRARRWLWGSDGGGGTMVRPRAGAGLGAPSRTARPGWVGPCGAANGRRCQPRPGSGGGWAPVRDLGSGPALPRCPGAARLLGRGFLLPSGAVRAERPRFVPVAGRLPRRTRLPRGPSGVCQAPGASPEGPGLHLRLLPGASEGRGAGSPPGPVPVAPERQRWEPGLELSAKAGTGMWIRGVPWICGRVLWVPGGFLWVCREGSVVVSRYPEGPRERFFGSAGDLGDFRGFWGGGCLRGFRSPQR